MNSAKVLYSEDALQQAQQQLNMLEENISGLTAAVLLSIDGFEIASLKVSAESASRLAAMGSSLAAIGVSIAHEGGLSDSYRLMLESEDGVISVSRVRTQPELALVVIVNDPATLGALAWTTKLCCQNLIKIFE